MQKGDEYNGIFFATNIDASGHLEFKNHRARATLTGDVKNLIGEGSFDVLGTLPDTRKVSVLECVPISQSQFFGEHGNQVSTTIHPHFVISGPKHISSDDSNITKITYQCEQAHLFCDNHETFGTIHPTPENMDALLDKEQESRNEVAKKNGWEPRRRTQQSGKHPLVAYYDGNDEIAATDFASGSLTIWNGISFGMGTSQGVQIANKVLHTINFHEPQTPRKAIETLVRLHQLYELLLGSRQKFMAIDVFTSQKHDEGEDGFESPLRLHWNGCNQRTTKREEKIHSSDIPVLASTDRELFETVVSGWLSAPERTFAARGRLFNSLLTNKYSPDRLIGAANVFDLLPEECFLKNDDIDEPLREATERSRKLFRDLPPSSPRDSVLSALGRIGKLNLRSKILQRAQVFQGKIPRHFRNLDRVCAEAVLCRNHYVHGSPGSFNYEESFSSFVFLTDTLEFIFVTADLVECGWNASEYMRQGSTLSHFMSQYIHGYERNLIELEALLGSQAG